MNTSASPLKFCIVGCGAITNQSHLPALSAIRGAKVVSLIDKNLERACQLAEHYGIAHWSHTVDDLPPDVEAAVIALPNNLHAPVSRTLMERGLHVFCEKPMATTSSDADAMIRCARERGVRLQIGTVRRYYWCNRQMKHLLASGELGRVVGVQVEEGTPHNWPTASGFFFDRKQSGGGVLIDWGAHSLDLVLWWLQDYPAAIECRHDGFGGVEAECELCLQFGSGEQGSIRLSRLRNLSNTYTLRFERGTASYQMYDPSGMSYAITIHSNGRKRLLKTSRVRRAADYYREQLQDFVRSVKEGTTALTAAESVAPSVRLIEQSYREATPLTAPWLVDGKPTPGPPSGTGRRTADLRTMKVLVTGASGFIGGRLVERLALDFGNPPRAALRSFNRAARIARFPTEMVIADVLDYEVLLKAVDGCDAIVHCAYGNTQDRALDVRINVTGTENVLRAAAEKRVRRVVHLSSIEVYGKNPPDIVDEETPLHESFHYYGNSKREAEDVCREYFKKHNVPVVILRLAAGYGPYAPWTVDVIERLLSRGFCQNNKFNGLCNPIYIDDCIDAIFLAMTRPGIEGDTFLISGGEALTWNEYFAEYNRMLRLPQLRKASYPELLFYRFVRQCWDAVFGRVGQQRTEDLKLRYKSLRERSRIVELRGLLRRGSLLAYVPVFDRHAFFSIDKARSKLGFEPQYPLRRGLVMVEEWWWGKHGDCRRRNPASGGRNRCREHHRSRQHTDLDRQGLGASSPL